VNEVLGLSAIVMLVLLFLKVPVYLSVLGGSAIYFVLNPSINTVMFAQRAITGVESISLLAIPFFVCAGILMNYPGVTKRIMDFCSVLTGRMSGGLAQVNVLITTLMGGLSGSTVVTATSSMITPLIPPGIAMILYGCIANVSIGKLFMAGLGIGALLCITMMILVRFISVKRGYQPLYKEKVSTKEFAKAAKPAILPLCLPIIIIGGIRFGIFTATEAGAIAILYAILLGVFYKELNLKNMSQGLKETVCTTSSIMLIVAAASVFSWILTKERIPQQLTEWIVGAIDNKYVFLLVINIFLLVVGMFIEGNASMIILVPLLAPIAASYGIDEIQFAMIYIFNNAIGALSPPMGTLMFVTCGITKCKTAAFIKEAVPFYILLVINLLLITYVPVFSTFFVNMLY